VDPFGLHPPNYAKQVQTEARTSKEQNKGRETMEEMNEGKIIIKRTEREMNGVKEKNNATERATRE
jgi:hypothetical protein